MNEKAIFEIGDIIHARKTWRGTKISGKSIAKQIIKSVEFQMFRKKYSELVELAMGKGK